MNTWPCGKRHAITNAEHEQWNARNYPGTRECCELCGEETGRCEEESGSSPWCDKCKDEQVNEQLTPCEEQTSTGGETKGDTLSLLELVDGVYELVSVYPVLSPAQKTWKARWLRSARWHGAGGEL